MASSSDKQFFILQMRKAVEAQPSLYGLFPSVIIAQAALESGWGTSRLSAEYNNYFGVKASPTQYSSAWNPQTSPTVNLATEEYDNGYNPTVATWRVYSSPADSLRDRNALLATNPRYSSALKATTPQQQVEAMKVGGYATDPDYVQKVMNTIASNNLTQYDRTYSELMHRTPETATTGRTRNRRKPFALMIVVLLIVVVALVLVKTKIIKLTK